MKFDLPELSYDYDGLEPFIDAKTMEIHHTKHHSGYTDKLNTALEQYNNKFNTIEEILMNIESVPENIRTAVINNGGGYFNHKLFFEIMSPEPKENPEGKLLKDITDKFGSFTQFKDKFDETAVNRFGSGWAWLVIKDKNELEVYSTPNQDSPLLYKEIPVMGIDVWEHAYYLSYQNRRPEYIKNWWKVVDWDKVEKIYETFSVS